MVWKKRKKKESGAVSVIWWRMCLGNYGPGQNFNCQRTLTMFFFFFYLLHTAELSFSLESYIHTYTVCVYSRFVNNQTHRTEPCVYKKENVGEQKKKNWQWLP